MDSKSGVIPPSSVAEQPTVTQSEEEKKTDLQLISSSIATSSEEKPKADVQPIPPPLEWADEMDQNGKKLYFFHRFVLANSFFSDFQIPRMQPVVMITTCRHPIPSSSFSLGSGVGRL
jgi:hypothetical protein